MHHASITTPREFLSGLACSVPPRRCASPSNSPLLWRVPSPRSRTPAGCTCFPAWSRQASGGVCAPWSGQGLTALAIRRIVVCHRIATALGQRGTSSSGAACGTFRVSMCWVAGRRVDLEVATGTTREGLSIHALGSIRVTRDGIEQRLGGPRQRRLLAVLLIHRDTVVPVDRVADVVFAGEPTEAAATTVRSYVARLRRVLGDIVVTRAPGYQLSLDRLCFDVSEFEADVVAGRVALDRQDPVAAMRAAALGARALAGRAVRRVRRRTLGLSRVAAPGRAPGHVPKSSSSRQSSCAATSRRSCRRSRPSAGAPAPGVVPGPADDRLLLRRPAGGCPVGFPRLPRGARRRARHRPVTGSRRARAADPRAGSSAVGAPSTGEPLRGYRLGERLGSGRDGTVRAAHLPGVDRELAVKTVRPDLADDPHSSGASRPLRTGSRRCATRRPCPSTTGGASPAPPTW